MPIETDLIITCPCCGHTFAPPLPETPALSDLAMRILTARGELAAKWRRGKWVSLSQWARLVLSNRESVRLAMLELVTAGYVVRVRVGTGRNSRYMAVPTMALRMERIAA